MNFGGLLRQAIKSGEFRRVVEVSRELMDAGRRDRALADLNARGGITGSGMSPSRYLRGQGIDPWESVPAGGIHESPFGARRISDGPHGGRVTHGSYIGPSTRSKTMGNPIEAPYEGMRVIPGGTRMGEPATDWGFSQPPSKWMGRGQGTSWEYGFPRGEALETTGPWEWGPDDMSYFPTDWGYSSGFGGWNWPWKFGGMYPSRPFGEPPVVRGYDGGAPF